MAWTRRSLQIGVGNRVDITETRAQIRHLREQLARKHSVDREQEERLAVLERNNEQQQILIIALAEILASHGLIDLDAVEPFIEALDDMPPSAGTIPSES